MSSTPSAPESSPPAALAAGPRCLVLTGTARSGKARWLVDEIRRVQAERPGTRCAVLSAELSPADLKQIAQALPEVALHRLFLPCLCCPGAANLPGEAVKLIESARADWLVVELPVVAATGLLAELTAALHWPREFVVCLDPAWAAARAADTLPPFHALLLQSADRVVSVPR
ncbi:hypothetical protein [Opitutus sp. ER46]|uniref:hypothetical protein n=1 Tax=Opitutus sp. ER46 TaxID=2161864 RepID=UPI0011B21A52|nr:hypothetical protein [Opitutus sp. ER46]